MCVCVKGREREKVCVCVCVKGREREKVCLCVCVLVQSDYACNQAAASAYHSQQDLPALQWPLFSLTVEKHLPERQVSECHLQYDKRHQENDKE